MALSPCQRHTARIMAEKALAEGRALSSSPDGLNVQLRSLDMDIERLRALPNIADRVEMKRSVLLPKWMPTVEQYLADGIKYSNPTFVYVVIWLFDVGDYDLALEWADIAIEQGQTTPDNIRSSLAAFVADTMLAWATAEDYAGNSVEPYFSRTFANIRETWRLHEEINAKWYKFAALLLLKDQDGKVQPTAINDIAVLEKADALLAQAHAYHPPVGVRTLRTKIAARVRALQDK